MNLIRTLKEKVSEKRKSVKMKHLRISIIMASVFAVLLLGLVTFPPEQASYADPLIYFVFGLTVIFYLAFFILATVLETSDQIIDDL